MRHRLCIYIIGGLLTVVFTACSSDSSEPQQLTQGPVITFDAEMMTSRHATTRTAENSIEDNAGLRTAGGFGVFGCYTGLYKYVDSNIHPDFMYNEHVTYDTDTDKWTYSPVKYWPNGEGMTNGSIVTGDNPHYVSFMAYAPYSDNNSSNDAGYCIPTFSHQGELGNPWLTYRLHTNVADQVDLLYAAPLLDQKKPEQNEKLTFSFNHALACVGDKVTIQCSEGLKNQLVSRVENTSATDAKVVVKSLTITYTLTAKGRMMLWNGGEPNWQTILSEAPVCTRTATIIDSNTDVYQYTTAEETFDPIEGKGVFYIPIELSGYPQTAELEIVYCTSTTSDGTNWVNDADNTATATINMKAQYPAAYQPGKHLYINITLNQSDIALTAAIAPWTEAEPIEVEGVEQ